MKHPSKSSLFSLLITLGGLVLTSCDTVHFTNSQSHLKHSIKTVGSHPKTYQLEVPGSGPITIIEADDYDSPREGKSTSDERKTKDYVVPGSTHEIDTGRCLGPSCVDFASAKNTVYSPDLLNKFLIEYADKIKNADQKTKDILHQMEITPTHTSDNLYQKKKITEKIDIQLQPDSPKKSQWEQANNKKTKHPFNDRDGWVSLEAVPWSKSKITKWQANTHKVNKPNMYAAFDTSNDRFTYGNSDLETDYDNHPFAIEKPSTQDIFEYKPSYPTDDWPQDTPAPSRPAWIKPQKPQSYHMDWNQEQRPPRPDCDHDHDGGYIDNNRRVSAYQFESDGGIITDGKPGNFPANPASGHKNFKRPSPVLYADIASHASIHPATHPSSGDGEWVLLSTTKGYQFPKSRQRSLSIAPTSISSRRSVRLTVLPAPNTTKENMTTSHGGLLEVEPSFHTVEESRKIHQRSNATKLKHIKLKNVIATNSGPDSSAVIAAVGAGLVPATVAMIMPMVLGRKKRSPYNRYFLYLTNNQNVTQHPHLDYESTIQRTLK